MEGTGEKGKGPMEGAKATGSAARTESSEEARAKRRLVREQKKSMKKANKEAEFLANLRKPKDTKVVLMDKRDAERLRIGAGGSARAQVPTAGFSVDSNQFPALSSSLAAKSDSSKRRMSYRTAVGGGTGKARATSRPSRDDPGTVPQGSSGPARGEKASHSVPEPEPKTGGGGGASKGDDARPTRSGPATKDSQKSRKIKKKDPIVLNFNELLVSKKPVRKDRKHAVYGSKYRRAREANALSGNILDASNPKRMRGKRRENEKRKLTKLKLSIVKSRIVKTKVKAVSVAGSEPPVDVTDASKEEVSKYLTDLMEKLKFSNKPRRAAREGAKDGEAGGSDGGRSDKAAAGKAGKGEPRKSKQTKYRKYCDNSYSAELDCAVRELIEGIVSLQSRAFMRDPIRANAKRRYVAGFREIKKNLMLKKVKLLVVAPDLEDQDAINDVVEELKSSASAQSVPYAFALNRRKLGFITKKAVSVSAFGVLSYEGLENRFDAVVTHLKEAKSRFAEVPAKVPPTSADGSQPPTGDTGE